MRKKITGSQMRVGDLVEWFTDGRAIKVTSMKVYDGPLAYLFLNGAQIAEFKGQIPSAATIDNSHTYTVLR